MKIEVTFKPRSKIQGVKATTIEFESPAEAWTEVQGLIASDEEVIVLIDGIEALPSTLRELAGRATH